MKLVEVVDASCGFRTRIAATMEDAATVRINVNSECEAAAKWGHEIDRVDWRECLGRNPLESHLWQSAMEILRHRSCPVLTAVLRAIETEVGAARPAKILIRFLSSGEFLPDQERQVRKKSEKRRYVIASEARQFHNSLNRREIATARCASQ